MSAAHEWDEHLTDGADRTGPAGPDRLSIAPDVVEVRRNAGLAALVGAAASGLAIAYLGRAVDSGGALDWTLCAVMAGVGIAFLRAFVDARTPLLVADAQGVRIRLGHTWRGLPWGALAEVNHAPRSGPLRDGRLVAVPHNPERVLAELDARGRRQSRLSNRLYGAPFAVPLGLTTRVQGDGGDLTAALARLADGTSVVRPVEADGTAPSRWRDPRPAVATAVGVVAGKLTRTRQPDPQQPDTDEDTAPAEATAPGASETPEPVRAAREGRRTEVTSQAPVVEQEPEPVGRELRRPGSVSLVEDTVAWGDRVTPIARPGDAVDPLVVDDLAAEPADDPVVGPELAAARTRLSLTVDQLAERTRIRPHVIECIEVDDFVPCGGDFYARGHLRTLARVLGVDVAPLLVAYDERYADAPVSPRRVFEAELATGASGTIRGTRGGPNWSVLIAAIMAVVLVWSVARLLMDGPAELQPRPVLNGSAGVGNGLRGTAEPVEVVLRSVHGGATVVVRDATGEVVFSGDIAHGESRELEAVPPVRVESSDAGAIEIHVGGRNHGTLGESGAPGRGTFIDR